MAVAERLWLGNEFESRRARAGRGAKGGFVTGADDDADLVGPGRDGLLDDDLQGRFGDAVTVDDPLEGKGVTVSAGGGNDCA